MGKCWLCYYRTTACWRTLCYMWTELDWCTATSQISVSRTLRLCSAASSSFQSTSFQWNVLRMYWMCYSYNITRMHSSLRHDHLQMSTLTRWHSYANLTRFSWRYTGCAKMNFLHQGSQKLSYYSMALDKHGGHTIGSAMSEKPLATHKPHGTIFYRIRVIGDRSLHCRNRNFWFFLLLWTWPWCDDLHVRIWCILPGDSQYAQIWTFYIKAFESNRLADRQTEKLLVAVEFRWP